MNGSVAQPCFGPYSVGIPVRNEALTLPACVQAVLDQEVPPAEVLICVNGSSDDSETIARALADGDARIRVLTSEPGKPNAWNAIVAEARAAQVLFVDGDVLLEPDCSRHFLEAMAVPGTLVVGGGHGWTNSADSGSLIRAGERDGVLNKDRLSGGGYLAATDRLKALAAREGIDLMPPDIIGEDALLECIARRHGGFVQVTALCWRTGCVTSIGDLVRVFRRISQGLLQLQHDYGWIVPPEFHWSRSPLVDRVRTRLAQMPGPRRKLAFVLVTAVRVSVRVYVRTFERRRRYDNLWPEARTTKVPFET